MRIEFYLKLVVVQQKIYAQIFPEWKPDCKPQELPFQPKSLSFLCGSAVAHLGKPESFGVIKNNNNWATIARKDFWEMPNTFSLISKLFKLARDSFSAVTFETISLSLPSVPSCIGMTTPLKYGSVWVYKKMQIFSK